MIRRIAALAVLVLLGSWTLKADVAPFPSWRLATNGTIARAVQAGDTVYIGGSFTKIGRGLAPFSASLDPATLALTSLAGCARREGTLVAGPYVDYPHSLVGPSVDPQSLADGDGPFVVPATTVFARVGPDCHYDRRFRVEVPQGVSVHDTAYIAELGDRIYFSAFIFTGRPADLLYTFVVEADRATGVVRRYWPMADSGVRIVGAVTSGRVLAKSIGDTGVETLGWFDPAQGTFVGVRPAGRVIHAGSVVVTMSDVGGGRLLTALDAVTLAPLPQWPVVRTAFTNTPVVASGGGLVFIAASEVTVDGGAAPRLLAFDTTTGARVGGFSAPAWLDDARGSFAMLTLAGARLLVFGDFAPGSPRDTAAALDAATGALDSWIWPYAAAPGSVIGRQVYFPQIAAADRVPRTYLAAVDERSGALLSWGASPAPPSPVTAVAIDASAGHVYAGWATAIRRFDATTAVQDPVWGLDLSEPSLVTSVTPSAMTILQNVLYVVGAFDGARERSAGAVQPREGAAAVTTGGTITAWRPMVAGVCQLTARPPLFGPCISDLQALDGRLIMKGSVRRLLSPNEPWRSVMAVDAATGAEDGFLPSVTTPVASIAVDGSTLYAVAQLGQPSLVKVDVASGGRVVAPLLRPSLLAVRAGRAYADLERDATSGLTTGNPTSWLRPFALAGGMLDANSVADWHGEIASTAPHAPIGVTAETAGPRVSLRWSPAAADLAPFVSPPPSGGTAATSYVVSASLTPGGPPVAAFDTASPDLTWSIDAPPGTFWLRVAGRNQFGTSAPSSEVAVQVSASVPERPMATRAVVSGAVARIEWQSPPRGWPATSYLLDAGTAPGLTNIGSLPVSGTSFQAAVPPGRYYVRVRAVNASGASAPGDEVILDVP